jgi:hypothetical protein
MDGELGDLLIHYECRWQVADRKLNGRSQVAGFLPRREQAGRTISECVAPMARDGRHWSTPVRAPARGSLRELIEVVNQVLDQRLDVPGPAWSGQVCLLVASMGD